MTAPADEWADGEEPAPPAEPAARPLEFPTLDRFVAEQLAVLYARPLGHGRVWCPQWWRHAEARSRLDALWRSWEHLRWEPALGMSVWFRDHADPHMAVLLDPDGPFHGCKPEQHAGRLTPLPVDPPPDGLFPAPASEESP